MFTILNTTETLINRLLSKLKMLNELLLFLTFAKNEQYDFLLRDASLPVWISDKNIILFYVLYWHQL